MLNKVAWCVVSFYLCPTEKREYNSSAEELLAKHKTLRYFNKRRIKKTSKFFTKRVAGLKRVCIFAVPNTGSAGV